DPLLVPQGGVGARRDGGEVVDVALLADVQPVDLVLPGVVVERGRPHIVGALYRRMARTALREERPRGVVGLATAAQRHPADVLRLLEVSAPPVGAAGVVLGLVRGEAE